MQKETDNLCMEFLKSIKPIDVNVDSFYKDFNLSLSEIKKFSTELFNTIINQPEKTIEILERKLEEVLGIKEIRVRLFDYDKGIKETKIRDLRANDIGKLILIQGYAISASDVRPQVAKARFECESCGTIIVVTQNEKVFREPTSCSCGNTKNLTFKSQELVDSQRIVVAEKEGEYEKNGSPKISVFLSEGLTNQERMVFENLGRRVSILGILKEVLVEVGIGKISTRLDLIIEANNYLFF